MTKWGSGPVNCLHNSALRSGCQEAKSSVFDEASPCGAYSFILARSSPSLSWSSSGAPSPPAFANLAKGQPAARDRPTVAKKRINCVGFMLARFGMCLNLGSSERQELLWTRAILQNSNSVGFRT